MGADNCGRGWSGCVLAGALTLLLGGTVAVARAEPPGDRSASAAAFLRASKVLLHPRCVNCHPAGERPLQGDDGHPHTMHVVRGSSGMGKNGLWCSTCHPEKNLPGPRLPPGGPGWQLPSEDVPMVFEKRAPGELCRQLRDPAKNGRRSPEQVVEHVREAPLVLWGWNPGEGRTVPPVGHDAFVQDLAEWAERGAACPE